MYLPKYFKETDETEILQLIRQHPFATLVTLQGTEPYVGHLPILLEENKPNKRLLIGHLARSNPQAEHLASGQEVLVVFHGPHTYISPRWYRQKENVPTWNYAVVHVKGKARTVSESRLRNILDQTVLKFEMGADQPWTFSENPDLTDDFRDQLAGAIAGFEISLDCFEAKFKLSQNREPKDFNGVLEGLRAEKDNMSRAVLELMLKRKI